MTRWTGWIAIASLVVVTGIALALYGGKSAPMSLDQRTRSLAAQLRCPVCQGESVADSQAPLSAQIRALIRRELAAGQSPSTIKADLRRSYGDRIVLAPPTTGVGLVAWAGPPLLVLGGIGMLVAFVASWRGQAKYGMPPEVDDAYLERARAELANVGIEDEA